MNNDNFKRIEISINKKTPTIWQYKKNKHSQYSIFHFSNK